MTFELSIASNRATYPIPLDKVINFYFIFQYSIWGEYLYECLIIALCVSECFYEFRNIDVYMHIHKLKAILIMNLLCGKWLGECVLKLEILFPFNYFI